MLLQLLVCESIGSVGQHGILSMSESIFRALVVGDFAGQKISAVFSTSNKRLPGLFQSRQATCLKHFCVRGETVSPPIRVLVVEDHEQWRRFASSKPY